MSARGVCVRLRRGAELVLGSSSLRSMVAGSEEEEAEREEEEASDDCEASARGLEEGAVPAWGVREGRSGERMACEMFFLGTGGRS